MVAEREAKSVSAEDTYDTDLVDRRLLDGLLDRQAAKVTERLRKARLSGRTVTGQGAAARLHHPHPVGDAGRADRQHPRWWPAPPAPCSPRWTPPAASGCSGSASPGWPTGSRRTCSRSTTRAPSRSRCPTPSSSASPAGAAGRPGMDVTHVDHGQGWVWGSGVGRVTVRFETAETGPGPVRTFRADDPGLAPLRSRCPTPSPTSLLPEADRLPRPQLRAQRRGRRGGPPRAPGSRPVVGWSLRKTSGRPDGGTCTAPSTIPSLGSSSWRLRSSAAPSSRSATRLESAVTAYGAAVSVAHRVLGEPVPPRPGPEPEHRRGRRARRTACASTGAGRADGTAQRQHRRRRSAPAGRAGPGCRWTASRAPAAPRSRPRPRGRSGRPGGPARSPPRPRRAP